MSEKFDLAKAYRAWVGRKKDDPTLGHDKAMQAAIGGEFEAFGLVEREMLIFFGLKPHHSVVDVGCGSGRLAVPLSRWLKGPYLGIDLVPDLVDYARASCARADWRFEVASGLTIPARDESADCVCFFSVLTHLLHEQSYIYLEEARRVLRPGGVIVFSFLEFEMPFHWSVFAGTVADARGAGEHPLNVFQSRGAIKVWAEHLGLDIRDVRNGDDAFVPLPHPITTEGGVVMEKFGNLGQSIAALVKP